MLRHLWLGSVPICLSDSHISSSSSTGRCRPLSSTATGRRCQTLSPSALAASCRTLCPPFACTIPLVSRTSVCLCHAWCHVVRAISISPEAWSNHHISNCRQSSWFAHRLEPGSARCSRSGGRRVGARSHCQVRGSS